MERPKIVRFVKQTEYVNLCPYCDKEAKIHNNKLKRYVCFKENKYCDGVKSLIKHMQTCDICSPKYKETENYPFELRIETWRYKDCELFKYMLIKRHHNSRDDFMNLKISNQKIRSELQIGEHDYKCAKCGEKANYLIGKKLNCTEKLKECPGYHKYISDKFIARRGTPEYREMMSERMLECQNRPSVKEAKRLKMLHLHNDDCSDCLDFQNNYNKAQIKRRGPNYEYFLKYRKKD